jgi:hypothetical protein
VKTNIEAGTKFGKWTVLREAPPRGEKRLFECACECGRHSDVYMTHLRRGASSSCVPCATVTHGQSHQPTWDSWSAMRDRCERITHTHFHNYGGRGISVCARWSDFANFRDDMGDRPEGMTLDRIDVNLGYSKENCKWSTCKEQSNNRRDNRIIEYGGAQYTVAQLADHLRINYQTLYHRIKRGMQLDAPVRFEHSNSRRAN